MLKFDEINLNVGQAARQVAAQPPRTVLILGASARAACQSARRAGLRPVAADLFADRDLQSTCHCRPVDNSHQAWIAASQELVSARTAWMYTGAFENRPQLVEQIANRLELWGTPADSLPAARDPSAIAAALDAAGLPSLKVRLSPPPCNPSQHWLSKPLLGSAGHGIQTWPVRSGAGETKPTADANRTSYFQQRATGHTMSAVFLTDRTSTCLLGTTSQLVGCSFLGASAFGYCGSIGPLRLPESVTNQIVGIGAAVAATGSVCGLFGIDLIHDTRDAWLTEVNPRYTASVEVLERALDIPFLAWHRWSCTCAAQTDPISGGTPAGRSYKRVAAQPLKRLIAGKLIVYAHRDVIA
ncbi:MAG: ATP-grasp domain-containing protein, partial [Planctomycetaceae bacterium]